MSNGKPALAEALLDKLVTDHSDDALVDEAWFERGRLALARGDDRVAREHLAHVGAASPLASSADYLQCRIAATHHHADATACIDGFAAEHPTSSRLAEVLGWREAP